jgi:segregation and condensation protein B
VIEPAPAAEREGGEHHHKSLGDNGTSEGQENAIASSIESVLLVAAEPVSLRALVRLFGTDRKFIRRGVDTLAQTLASRGIRLQEHEDRLQLVTAPENAELVREFLRLPRQPRLSRAALETAAIIAYRQPVTKAEIEEIRGVGADRVIATLLGRGVIDEIGRRDTPGRPIEYATTDGFLELFGMTSLGDLPATDATAKSESPEPTPLGLKSYEAQ